MSPIREPSLLQKILLKFFTLLPLYGFSGCDSTGDHSTGGSFGGTVGSTNGGTSAIMTTSTVGNGGTSNIDTPNSGGTYISHTTSAKGGTVGSGGTSAKGGTVGSGGTSAKGGTVGSGGTSAKGGTVGSGGTSAKGGTVGSGGSSPNSTHSGVWKMTFLGDSITGTTCYPQLLAQTLKSGLHTNFQFVGSNLNNQSCNGAPTQNTEGHGGYLVTYLTTANPAQTGKGSLTELNSWTDIATDVVLIHFGTNDVWNNVAPLSIISAYEFVISKYRAKNPNVIFFVSKIISMNPTGCNECSTRVINLNAQITSAWATANSTATSPTYIIDHSDAIVNASDTADGVHPNVTGAQKMATVTYDALIAQNLPGL
jgi:lysophospholipase L1-like esterase